MEQLLLSIALALAKVQEDLVVLKAQQVQESKIDLINAIEECESQGDPTAVNWEDAEITGYPSRGVFQFQPFTFLEFAKKYKVIPQDAKPSLKELQRMIETPIYSRAVAHGMIKDGLVEQHWKICYRKYQRSLALR